MVFIFKVIGDSDEQWKLMIDKYFIMIYIF